MKLVCDREKLANAFQVAALFAPSRSPKAILQNIKLVAESQAVTLMATDLEVGVRVRVDGVEVDKEGSAVLPVTHFGAIVRESSDEKLRIETNTKGTTIKGDRSEFKLPAADPDEFPTVAVFEEKKFHTISASLFRQIILRTEFATDMESSRYALGGVLMELDANSLIAVGTDGRRLAKMEGPAEATGGHKSGENATIIRTPSLKLIARALTDSDNVVHLACRTNDVLIQTERATYYSRLVEGRFPKWRDVFPARRDGAKIDLIAGPFLSCLRQAAIVTSNDSRGIDFTFGAGTLTLNASTAESGQSRIEMPISYDGQPITVTLDHRFVSDFLKVLNPESNVILDIENAETAAVFYADEEKYGYVVMPLSRDR